MNARDLAKMNIQKSESLTEENKKVYEGMRIHLGFANVPELQLEELLLEILNHMLDGQKDEKNAHEIFGPDLEAYCNELIASLPKRNHWQTITNFIFMTSIMFGIYFAFTTGTAFIGSFFIEDTRVSIIHINLIYIAAALWLAIFMLKIVIRISKREAFTEKQTKYRMKIFIFYQILSFVIFLALAFLILDKFLFSFQLQIWQGAILALIFYALYKILYQKVNF
ncbi:DUF1129 family protein [Bacillus gaemokensis]|uniref:DUF1129 domain-containing protein n=1 Tax=Bacillus gaemokensis TaxID=574375 RepID=A0A073KUS4_9BACI|nr:DUF1129 family protein [Bacillus gaemokensis]KEK26138.1 hypothetical protein BAGA_02570 [Bacillus gaemokensis]KYG38949.1 hypothetical protein AZF08_02625 [Bacillus gaemokensis]